MKQNKGIVFFGGSFNPPHIGHLRLAIEAWEAFNAEIDRVIFVPCALHPQKNPSALLPFSLRCEMLEACIRHLPFLGISTIEGERDEPSYTYETLAALRLQRPVTPFYFLLGSDDYEQLPTWYRGLELPRLTNFLVVPRGVYTESDFIAQTHLLWPEAGHTTVDRGRMCIQGGGEAVFFQTPSLSVRATDVRNRWCAGRSIDFLVPSAVRESLSRHEARVREIWDGGV
ncbi:MAG: nicotinate (nicotinamide) nucleotide adenylyltransferase [Desulfovibrio sp.]|nr:nicotinate (nicotinamide) nucleotide adenylyltransferase [Desulfovibrio sp.]